MIKVYRAFKSYYFFATKKKVTGSAWNFPQATMQFCKDGSMPYFKINALFFSFLLYFEEYINTQIKINKMVQKDSVKYHPSPSRLISKICFYNLSLSIIFVKVSLNHVYGAPIPRNCNCKSKNWVYSCYSCFQTNSPPGSYHHPQAEGNYPFSPFSTIFATFIFLVSFAVP